MANTGKVLVTGATGNVASGLIPALRSAGVEVRALVHDESKPESTEGGRRGGVLKWPEGAPVNLG